MMIGFARTEKGEKMSRLIDADALKESIQCSDTEEKKILSPKKLHDVLNEWIDSRPTIEPERKKGKWIQENIALTTCPTQYQWHCSECGRVAHWFNTEILTNYCPNCGCSMSDAERWEET